MPHNFSYIIPGKLAGMARPGVIQELEGELAVLRKHGIGAVVSLTEEALDKTALKRQRMAYLHIPLRDFSAPELKQISQFVEFVSRQNAQGQAVAAHCGAGMGRTGTMLACYLVYLGEKAEDAVESVRTLRPGSIETDEQENCVINYARHLKRAGGEANV